MQAQDTSPTSVKEKDAHSHLLKVRQLVTPEMMANEPDQDQTEVFLAAAERGESAKVRRVGSAATGKLLCDDPEISTFSGCLTAVIVNLARPRLPCNRECM